MQDAAITGLNRDDVGMLVFPRLDECRKLAGLPADAPAPEVLHHPAVRAFFQRLLATSGSARSRFAPDVPTYVEQGFKDLAMGGWYVLFMPAGTPANVVASAAQAIGDAVRSTDLAEAFAQFGVEAAANTPAELAAAVEAEHEAWGPIVKKVGFTPEA